jgi:hypothetical protein
MALVSPAESPSAATVVPAAADPLGFLAGRRYTCYCGRSLVGAMLCDSCAEEMVARLSRPRGPSFSSLEPKLARTDH